MTPDRQPDRTCGYILIEQFVTGVGRPLRFDGKQLFGVYDDHSKVTVFSTRRAAQRAIDRTNKYRESIKVPKFNPTIYRIGEPNA